MTEQEKQRAVEIQQLIDSVPMMGKPDAERLAIAKAGGFPAWDQISPGTQAALVRDAQRVIATTPREQLMMGVVVPSVSETSTTQATCTTCYAEAPVGGTVEHKRGCKHGPPVEPGRLTGRARCPECKQVGYDGVKDMPPFAHAPGCSGQVPLVLHLDMCDWRGEDGPCGALAVAVRARTLMCARHAVRVDAPFALPGVDETTPGADADAEMAAACKALALRCVRMADRALAAAEQLADHAVGEGVPIPNSTRCGQMLAAASVALKLAAEADILGDKSLARR